MFLTGGGYPAGYGYFEINSQQDINIMPDMITYFKNNDTSFRTGDTFHINTISIQVDSDTRVSINERAPILVQPNVGLSFDAVGIFSIKFKSSGVKFNICASY